MQDIDGGLVTPEKLPEAVVSQESEEAAEQQSAETPPQEAAEPQPAETPPQPTEVAPEPTKAGAIEETPQPGSPVEAQQEAPSNVNRPPSYKKKFHPIGMLSLEGLEAYLWVLQVRLVMQHKIKAGPRLTWYAAWAGTSEF